MFGPKLPELDESSSTICGVTKFLGLVAKVLMSIVNGSSARLGMGNPRARDQVRDRIGAFAAGEQIIHVSLLAAAQQI
jgi:hypothetical protein